MTRTQTYDAGDRIASILLEKPNGIDLQSFAYEYGFDDSGNRTADYAFGFVTGLTELDGPTVTYDYDQLGRLTDAVRTGTGAFDQAYSYEDAYNRLSLTEGRSTTTFSYDDANQLISDGSITFDYDCNGNLTRAGSDDLAYDPANDWVSGRRQWHEPVSRVKKFGQFRAWIGWIRAGLCEMTDAGVSNRAPHRGPQMQ